MLNSKCRSNGGEIGGTYLAQKGHRDTSAEEFAEMLGGELAQGIDDMRLDSVGGFFRVIGEDGDDLRREVGVVNRIMNRYRDLKGRSAVDWRASNASPHGLKMVKRSAYRVERIALAHAPEDWRWQRV